MRNVHDFLRRFAVTDVINSDVDACHHGRLDAGEGHSYRDNDRGYLCPDIRPVSYGLRFIRTLR